MVDVRANEHERRVSALESVRVLTHHSGGVLVVCAGVCRGAYLDDDFIRGFFPVPVCFYFLKIV